MLRLDRIHPTVLVLAGIASVQFGAALAKSLFDEVGAGGTVFLRVLFAALVLAAFWRPTARGHSGSDWRLGALFGLTVAAMNLAFYESLDGLGVALALIAGGFWAAYILLSVRVGRRFPGGNGLALAMGVGAVALLPVGVADAGGGLLAPWYLAAALGVAILSSAIPYTVEMEALRRLPAGVFGAMMSIEPAMAAPPGLVLLDEGLAARELVAILLVVAASAGAARNAHVPPRDA